MNIAILNRFSKDFYDYSYITSNSEITITFYNSSNNFFSSTENITVKNYKGFDKTFFLDIIRDHQRAPFDRLIALSEYDLERVSDLRSYLNIKNFEPINNYIFRDKYLMKEYFNKFIPTPSYKKIESFVDIIKFIDEKSYPVVIKPRFGSGSESVLILHSEIELRDYIAQSPELNLMMIEEYIDGQMYHIDGFMNCGKLEYFPSKYVNGCLAFNQNQFLGSFGIEDIFVKKQINDFIIKMFSPFKELKSSFVFHLEIFNRKNELLLCEVASRIGGGYINDVLEERTNINFFDLHFEIELNGKSGKKIAQSNKNFGFIMLPYKKGVLLSTIPFYSNKIKKIDWDENLIGHKFDEPDSSIDHYIGYVFDCTGMSESEIIFFMKEIYEFHEKKSVWSNDD